MVVVAFGLVSIVCILVVTFDARRFRRRLEATSHQLSDAHVQMRRLLDDLPDAVLGLDADGRIESANVRATHLTGRSVDDLVGRSFLGMVAEDDQEDITDRWRRLNPRDESSSIVAEERDTAVFELVDTDGRTHLVEASVHRPATFEPGTEPGLVVVLRDVTDRERNHDALEAARRRFQLAFQSAPTGMALVRLEDNKILDANRSLADMLDHSRRYLVGRSIRDITHPDDLRAAAAERARIELGIDDGYRLEQRYLRRDGEYIWAKTQVSVTDDDGVPIAITHIEDVTEQRKTAEDLAHAATHDDLTSLPNRASILARINEALVTAGEHEVAVLFIDLDNFKIVNDSLGHGVGDELLRHVASRFRSVMREGDQLARFGGDEFVVFIDGRNRQVDVDGMRGGPLDPAKVAERLQRSVEDAVTIDGQEITVTASIGYTTNERLGMSAEDLLRHADAAMYRAKASGRDRFAAFTDTSRAESASALQTAGDLRRALAGDELVPYFQPIVDLRTGQVTSYEVLARWMHPDRGLLGPGQFLPVAEVSGLLAEVGEHMLRNALSQLARWRANDDPAGRASLSVNLAAQQLGDPHFVTIVRDALGTSGIEADALWFEITETALLTDVAAASTALRELRGLGVHLSVDDFGTGYSSLTYLKKFPVEAIKVDQSFVSGLGIEVDDSSIVDAVIRLGHSLGLRVIAEGVETPLQLQQLRELGADRGQGYLFGRPMPAHLLSGSVLAPT